MTRRIETRPATLGPSNLSASATRWLDLAGNSLLFMGVVWMYGLRRLVSALGAAKTCLYRMTSGAATKSSAITARQSARSVLLHNRHDQSRASGFARGQSRIFYDITAQRNTRMATRCGGVDSDTRRCAWPTESRTDNKGRQADTDRRIVVSRCNFCPHHCWKSVTNKEVRC